MIVQKQIVCRKPWNFTFIRSNIVVDIVRVRINAIRFIFFEADVRTFEAESLRDVSVIRIGDTFPMVFRRLSSFKAKTEVILNLWLIFTVY